MSVLLVAAKQDVVTQRMALLQDAGLRARIVDVDAFALFNAFEHNYPEATLGSVALVNVGHDFSTVNVLQDGVPVLTRDIPFGSRRIREDLRRMRGLTAEEAEAALLGDQEEVDDFPGFLRQSVGELVNGIERAIGFLALSDSEQGAVERVFLCGGGVRIPHLADLIGEQLHVRTEVASPVHRLPVRPGPATLFPLEELSPMLMLPVGLALRPPR